VVNAAKDSAPAAVQQLTGGGAHVSIDALGEAITCQNSIMSLRLRGRHLQIGLTSRKEQGQVALPIDVIVLNELRVIGTVGMQPHRYAAMLGMVASGQLRPGKLIGRTVPIEQAGEVLASMTQYATLGTTVVDRW
jgi:alcohol dehydrogenase